MIFPVRAGSRGSRLEAKKAYKCAAISGHPSAHSVFLQDTIFAGLATINRSYESDMGGRKAAHQCALAKKNLRGKRIITMVNKF